MIFTYYNPYENGLVNEDREGNVEAKKLFQPDDSPSEGDASIPPRQLDEASTMSTSDINDCGRLRLMFRRYYDYIFDDGVVVCWRIFFLTFFQQTSCESPKR